MTKSTEPMLVEEVVPKETQSVADSPLPDMRRFAMVGKMIMRDLNNLRSTPVFYKYTKDEIFKYLKNPYTSSKKLREASIYMYNVSSHYRRLIKYFAGLSDLVYVISPNSKVNTAKASINKTRKQFRDCAAFLDSMDIKKQGEDILTVCFREDTYYCTAWMNGNKIIFQQLPSEYCDIAVIEDNVFNVSFDFTYFDIFPDRLDMYPKEFAKKYRLYKKDIQHKRWQELDSPTSFAIKANSDIPNYPIPPFAGIFREIYDLEDYKTLKLTKTELENYAMLVMKLGIDKDGNWEMPLEKAEKFFNNLESVLPEEVGAVLSPMDISKISFEKTGTADVDNAADAEQQLYSSAGVSSLLFNNTKASSNALLLSIKVDQAMTYSIVKSIECALNRMLHAQSFGRNFDITFLDCSPFNRKELGDAYLKACQFGIPMISYYSASQGLLQVELDGMNFLEDDVLDFKNRFTPLRSSATMSSDDGTSGEAGRPEKETGEITDNGEVSKENEDGDDDMM